MNLILSLQYQIKTISPFKTSQTFGFRDLKTTSKTTIVIYEMIYCWEPIIE
jgi:hypothetical protein